jgi:hypothetical protein
MGLAVAKPQAIKNMLTRIVCPNCGHVGATSAMLPRVLICSQRGHAALIRSGKQARSHITQEEDVERAGPASPGPRPAYGIEPTPAGWPAR